MLYLEINLPISIIAMLGISSELQRIALTHCTEEMHRFSIQKYICRGILIHSGVSKISFRGGFNIFLKKWGYLHGAKRHAARGKATRLLGGFGGMPPRENFLKWCNLVRFREYFAKILSKNNLKNSHFLYKNNR